MDDTLQTRNDLPANPLLLDELRGLILGVRGRVAPAVNKELVMLYARHAITCPLAETKYFRCSPTGC